VPLSDRIHWSSLREDHKRNNNEVTRVEKDERTSKETTTEDDWMFNIFLACLKLSAKHTLRTVLTISCYTIIELTTRPMYNSIPIYMAKFRFIAQILRYYFTLFSLIAAVAFHRTLHRFAITFTVCLILVDPLLTYLRTYLLNCLCFMNMLITPECKMA
jgi:hypothetical protein